MVKMRVYSPVGHGSSDARGQDRGSELLDGAERDGSGSASPG